MSTPLSNGQVDAQQDSVVYGAWISRRLPCLETALRAQLLNLNWNCSRIGWAFCESRSLRGGSMTSMIAVCSSQASYRLRYPTLRRLPSLFVVAPASSALCISSCGKWLLELYTHTPCRTFIFLTHVPCVAYRHHVRAWLKVFAVCMSYLSISPSPFSCFIHRLCCSRTVTSTLRSRLHLPSRTVPDPKARVKRTSVRGARRLATWPIPRTPQVMSPKSSTRLLLQVETRRPSTIWTTITSLTSQKSHARTLDSSVFPQC